jgi:MYXO-CTERM domain-containing protein
VPDVTSTSSGPAPAETPEPATLTLAALGVLGAYGYKRRRRTN